MNKTSLLVAAGLVILATACKENNIVKPAALAPSTNVNTITDNIEGIFTDDSIYVNIGSRKPVRIKGPVKVKLTPPQTTPKEGIITELPLEG